MKCAYSTNIGAKRKINQDACLAAEITNNGTEYYVFAAADGLGGHRSGEVASQMAVDFIKDFPDSPKIIRLYRCLSTKDACLRKTRPDIPRRTSLRAPSGRIRW